MRTALFLMSGLMLLAASAILARLFAPHYSQAPGWGNGLFIGVWLAITAGNMWVGVSKAGYGLSEELPIFLLLFGVPALVAAILKWKGI